jgi:hypothetical protein
VGILWQRVSAEDGSRHRNWQELVAALDLFPLPSLILGRDGIAMRANAAWTDISFAPQHEARGTGWLRVVDAAGRDELRARLRAAAADATAGSADCWLTGASQRPRLSRWWWRPGPVGQLVACVADLGTRVLTAGAAEGQTRLRYQPAEVPTAAADLLDVMVRRLFGAGLQLQRILDGADGLAGAQLDQIVAALDELILDARMAALGPLRSARDR